MARVPILITVALVLVCCSAAAIRAATRPVREAPPQRLAVSTIRAAARSLPRLLDRAPDPHEISVAELAPPRSVVDHVWFIPKGSSVAEVAVAWRMHFSGFTDSGRQDRSALTLWHPVAGRYGRVTWVPHTLIHASPYPFTTWKSVRLADVTNDGHADLLVTIECGDCNHATATVSVYRTGERPRKIYGSGVFYAGKTTSPDVAIRGRTISETEWGAQHGLLWFDEGGYVWSKFRLRTFLRWTAGGWRTVKQQKLRPGAPYLPGGFPYP